MSVPILDTSAWREFRGKPSSVGVNETTHLAKIADLNGKLHDCYVKLLPTHYPSLLCEAIGWLLARSSGVSCAPFAAIVLVPLAELRKSISLPAEFDGIEICPAWCCEIVAGKSVRQIYRWVFFRARQKCLKSKDAPKIASFDVWTDLRDRNYGNVIRTNSGYISIDHETILHDLLWPQTGKTFHSRSLLLEANQHLPNEELKRFKVDMANAAQHHAIGLGNARQDLEDIIGKIYPLQASDLIRDITNTLNNCAQAGWLSGKIGVYA